MTAPTLEDCLRREFGQWLAVKAAQPIDRAALRTLAGQCSERLHVSRALVLEVLCRIAAPVVRG